MMIFLGGSLGKIVKALELVIPVHRAVWCLHHLGTPWPRTRWLQQQKCVSSQFWRAEVQSQGASRVDTWWALPSGCRQLFFPWVLIRPLSHAHVHRESSQVSLLVRTRISSGPTLTNSFHLHYFLAPNTATQGLGLQHRNLGRHIYSVRNIRYVTLRSYLNLSMPQFPHL